MMLRLCNVNRCGVYNCSWLSWGGACCSSPWDAPGWPQPWQSSLCMGGSIPIPARVLPRECPPSAANPRLWACLLCELTLHLCYPVKKVFFCPPMGKNPICKEAVGLGELVECLGWLQSPDKFCLGDAALLALAEYIPPPSLP